MLLKMSITKSNALKICFLTPHDITTQINSKIQLTNKIFLPKLSGGYEIRLLFKNVPNNRNLQTFNHS